jgi:hypothetical protein
MIGFSACKGKDTVPPSDKNPPEVIVVNTTTDTVNIYQNNVRQNNTSSIYPDGATGYLPFLRGTQNFQIRRTGTTDVLFTKAVALDSATNYTFFVAGTTADKFFTTVDPITAAFDTLENNGSVFIGLIRMVNASYNSGPLNVTMSTNDTVNINIKSLAFGTTTPFMKFNASQNQEVKIYLSNSTIAQLDTTIAFQSGSIYTIYTKGSPTGKGNSAFGIGITTNQYIPLNQ